MVRKKTLGHIEHIGIKVDDIGKYVKIFQDLGGIVYYRGVAEKYDADCTFIRFNNIDIELIKGIGWDKCNLNKQKDGLHHLAFKGKGKYKGAKKGMLVNFNKPNKNNKILLEMVSYD